jgi:hypothetical protein
MKPMASFHSSRKNDSDPREVFYRSKAPSTDYNFQASPFGPYGRPAPGDNNGRSSIHLLSRKIFRREFIVEAFMFICLVLISAWPIAYLIHSLTVLIK